jgi:hypothetical protein
MQELSILLAAVAAVWVLMAKVVVPVDLVVALPVLELTHLEMQELHTPVEVAADLVLMT